MTLYNWLTPSHPFQSGSFKRGGDLNHITCINCMKICGEGNGRFCKEHPLRQNVLLPPPFKSIFNEKSMDDEDTRRLR